MRPGPIRAAVASLCVALAMSLVMGSALAVQPDEVLPDRGLETRARGISEELRCLVCQNQSIDDSDAPLAHDLRVLVRDRLKQGDDDDAVRRYVVARYGEFVLLKPVVAWHTLLLWLGPPLVLVAGIAGLLRRRRLSHPAGPDGLTGDEQSRLDEILGRGRT